MTSVRTLVLIRTKYDERQRHCDTRAGVDEQRFRIALVVVVGDSQREGSKTRAQIKESKNGPVDLAERAESEVTRRHVTHNVRLGSDPKPDESCGNQIEAA